MFTLKKWYEIEPATPADKPQPAPNHPLQDWYIKGNWIARQYPSPVNEGSMAVELICEVTDPNHRDLIVSAPRLARENEALREALKLALIWAEEQRTIEHGKPDNETNQELMDYVCSEARAALALASSVPSTPKPPSDATTGQPEGKKGAI